MPLTPHDEDLVKLSDMQSDDSGIQFVGDMEGFRMDPTIAERPEGGGMYMGLGADAPAADMPRPMSLKTLIPVGLALLGAWLLIKKLRRK